MEIFGVDHHDSQDAVDTTAPAAFDHNATARVTRVFEHLMDVGIDAKGPFDSAQEVAEVAMLTHSDAERAIDAIVRSHLRLAAAGGFVTSLGGFVTLPIALPANVVEFYLVATRMVAGIASTRGYDILQPEVRSAVLLALVGADSDDLLKKAGYASTGRLAGLAVQRLPGPVLLAVNKGVAFRLLNQVGKKSLTRFGKAVPLAGGVVGAGVDAYLLNRIADHARHEFPQVGRPVF
ncbi:MAG: EcsC family protein [Dermatophilaceae bacterium]